MSCPICRNPTAPEYRPFCSRRCADIDLGRWLNGSYAIPSDEPIEPDDPSAEPGPDTFDQH
ncbi:DNA gyrase inhibitor YacG [Tropicimonas sp. IMCC34043]|uniref:DNA gyrase inhibitor YacG n=1 Tax=Tropicimonas sp. IMCC34043 TaxID=2248760 RepID=UPI000E26368C|nr:DNA gyrase inhibitor YacG [Tropicimonas sp. IMCC34043]